MVNEMEINCFEQLIESVGIEKVPEGTFTPVAKYYSDMDCLSYVNLDCSYRTERVDAYLTVFWHPQEDRLVGVKLKGFRFLFTRLKNILDLKEAHFIPMVKAIELALAGGYAEALMAEHEKQEKIKRLYAEASNLVVDVNVEIDPSWALAA